VDVAKLVVVLVDQQEARFRATAVDTQISHLASPARGTASLAEFVFEIN